MPITAKVIPLDEGEGVSDQVAPFIGQVWMVNEIAAECPPGTDGALIWRANGLIVKVTNVGEFSSEAFSPPLVITDTEPVIIQAVGMGPGQGATVTLNYEQRNKQ